jgi:hypothetical protein
MLRLFADSRQSPHEMNAFPETPKSIGSVQAFLMSKLLSFPQSLLLPALSSLKHPAQTYAERRGRERGFSDDSLKIILLHCIRLDLKTLDFIGNKANALFWTQMDADCADSEEKSAFPPALVRLKPHGARVNVNQRPDLISDNVYHIDLPRSYSMQVASHVFPVIQSYYQSTRRFVVHF